MKINNTFKSGYYNFIRSFNGESLKKIGIFIYIILFSQVTMALGIKTVAYSEHTVIPIVASTFTATEIRFGKGEEIENVQNGDVAAWSVDISKNIPNAMFLKPTMPNSNTNMIVVTNRHTYYFHLKSTGHHTLSDTYALRFIYPEDKQLRLMQSLAAPINTKRFLHSDYSFHGSRSIMPLHVYDDGRFTYMQLRPNQAIPAVFIVDNRGGYESMVNFRRQGSYLVVHRLAPQFTLRDGKFKVASIFNNAMIRKLKSQ